MKKIFIYGCMLLISITAFSQTDPDGSSANLSPEGLMDNIYDQYGNSFKLSDLIINKETRDSNGQVLRAANSAPVTCGYFNLYFEYYSGFESATDPIQIQRRNVLCQVLTDISNFIVSPLTTSNKKVNIWVRNPNSVGMPPTALGGATSFYSYALNSSSGIIDGEIWKTIHTGQDSYNYLFPLNTNNINANNGLFFHGWMSFNVASASISWNLDTTIACPASKYDLYTTLLHEITHALGFASLINNNGLSTLNGSKIYSRYDTFLKNNSATEFIVSRPTSCDMYNPTFNPALSLSVLQPNPSSSSCSFNNTVCNAAIRFVGTGNIPNVPVYTPNCYEGGSSFSHFEDQCVSPFTNNAFFAMAERQLVQSTKRYLKPVERDALCNIGYALNTNYTSTAFSASFNYGSSCGGINVAGQNDGIRITGANLGTFSYVVNVGSTINISGILNNDTNANTFECLEDLTATTTYPTSLSATSGNNSTSIIFMSNLPGMHLLRYVPVSISGQKGNITYIYVMVNKVCPAVSCDLIKNGGFENSINCGQFQTDGYPGPSVDCWTRLSLTPDLYNRTCTNPYTFNTIIPTSFSTPPTDTWNSTGNNKFLGLGGLRGSGREAMQTKLSSSILPNTQYVLTFKAKVLNNFRYNNILTNNLPADIIFAGSQYMQAQTYISTQLPTALINIATVTVPNNNQWNYFSVPLNNVTRTLNYLSVINGFGINLSNDNTQVYVVLDDISIIQQNGSFVLPTSLCRDTQSISDLRDYLDGLPINGVFSGPGVNFNGSTYTLNEMFDMGGGLATISYTYTNASGCQVIIYSNINVEMPITPIITGSNMAYTIAPNNTTVNGATIPIGYTALWSITGGSGTITTANNQSSVGVTWTSLPGNLTLTLTSPGGCTFTATKSIINQFNCDCLNTFYFTATQTAARTATFTVLNSNPNCTSTARYRWNYGDNANIYLALSGNSHTYVSAGTYLVTLYTSIVGDFDEVLCSGSPYLANVAVTSGGRTLRQSNPEGDLVIYPTPASSVLNFIFSLNKSDFFETVIRTVEGKELIRKKWDLKKGKHEVQLELPHNISDGMVFVEISSSEVKEVRTVIVKKN